MVFLGFWDMFFKGLNGEFICMYFYVLGVKDRVGIVVLF